LSSTTNLYGDYIPLIIRIITPIITLVKRRGIMIIFNRLWAVMEEKKISTYVLRERCGIDSKTIRRLKANENVETKTLDKLCSALNCKLEDIAEFVENAGGRE
jgi:DNA-binding Xre family transcriptional regulator